MSKRILLTADSTCDMSPELLTKYEVRLMPLYITLGEKTYRDDGKSLSVDNIYQIYETEKILPKTAAVSPGEYQKFFEEALKEADTVIHFSLSGDISASHNNARIAAGELENVYVIDTKQLSTGMALIIIKGAELVAEGKPVNEIVALLQEMTTQVQTSFLIDNLEFLYKGGRCSALAFLGANLLKLKPGIDMQNGKLDVGKKYRGRLSAVLPQYVAEKLQNPGNLDLSRVFITHTKMEDSALVDLVREEIKKHAAFEEILETNAGCTITAHCGKNTLGILFMVK